MLYRFALIGFIFLQLAFGRWGWGSHRYINDKALDCLPPAMSFFQTQRSYLVEHSIDPDTNNDPNPGFYHYIDIDYYPEFFAGTLPHDYQEMIDLYGLSLMQDNGLVPWVIQWWKEDLQALMAAGNWNDVWQVAAELGHYVADAHQALHLTLNYNGQLTGNWGIHSRYETDMMNQHLNQLNFPDTTANYWPNVLDSVFSSIDDIYPLVELVMLADDRAYDLDPAHGSSYYTALWNDIGDTTVWSLHRAAVDLASIWYSAWIDAGSPYPAGVNIEAGQLPIRLKLQAAPNPSNAGVQLTLNVPAGETYLLRIHDLRGRVLTTFSGVNQGSGPIEYFWDAHGSSGLDISSGIYLCRLSSGSEQVFQKITLIK